MDTHTNNYLTRTVTAVEALAADISIKRWLIWSRNTGKATDANSDHTRVNDSHQCTSHRCWAMCRLWLRTHAAPWRCWSECDGASNDSCSLSTGCNSSQCAPHCTLHAHNMPSATGVLSLVGNRHSMHTGERLLRLRLTKKAAVLFKANTWDQIVQPGRYFFVCVYKGVNEGKNFERMTLATF